MNFSLSLYQSVLRAIVTALELVPPRRIEREEVELRKGHYAPETEVPTATVWIHGASLGEVITLRPLLKALAQAVGRRHLLGTTMTMDGLKRLRADDLVEFTSLMPVELPEFLDPFIARLRPSLLLIAETEIWPLLLSTARRHGLPYGIINGRINPKTVKVLRLFASLFRTGLHDLKFVLCQSQEYADRYASLGIPRSRIQVLGSFKHDLEPV
ncbi:MAG TPA: glycosyltransferase N-terminal domain-containing protein, partial [Candidatus Ozemobacteraceae bacterium]|nr:glycosyltransferase N-terminal domain-containing protein [Candidatus Ozemobacteraceae bacterium]